MANNYIQFSEALDLSSDSIVRDQQIDWINQVLNVDHDSEDLDRTKSILESNGIDTEGVNLKAWGQFLWKIESGTLFIYSEEYSDPYDAGLFVREFMRQFNIPGVWTLQWAETCSKPRIGEFGGGAMLVDNKNIVVKTTSQILNELLERM